MKFPGLTAGLFVILAATVAFCIDQHLRYRDVRVDLAGTAIKRAYGAPLDCTVQGRLTAANLHYRAACLLTAIRICSQFYFTADRARCNEYNRVECDRLGDRYEEWLRMREKAAGRL